MYYHVNCVALCSEIFLPTTARASVSALASWQQRTAAKTRIESCKKDSCLSITWLQSKLGGSRGGPQKLAPATRMNIRDMLIVSLCALKFSFQQQLVLASLHWPAGNNGLQPKRGLKAVKKTAASQSHGCNPNHH